MTQIRTYQLVFVNLDIKKVILRVGVVTQIHTI